MAPFFMGARQRAGPFVARRPAPPRQGALIALASIPRTADGFARLNHVLYRTNRMLVKTLVWSVADGWSSPLPAELDSPGALAIVFGGAATPRAKEALAELAAVLPSAVRTGCSTAGEIAGGRVRDDSLTVAIARFDAVRLRKVTRSFAAGVDVSEVGRSLGNELASDDLRAVLVLCDGLSANGSDLAAGIGASLPAGVEIAGGLAGDGDRFGSTWVLGDEGPIAGHVTVVGMYGEALQTGHGCHAGWSSFGPERTITRSQGNVLYELDGKPALSLYRTYLGERASGLPATALLFPLSVRHPDDDGMPVVRTILGMNEDEQSLRFAGNVPQGYRARLMRTRTDSLVQSAGLAGARAAQSFSESAQPLAIAVSCVGRRLVLGERTEEEIESLRVALPRDAMQVGFYSYGEFGRRTPGGACDLHNQTMTVTLFDEAAA